jgi:hypothetical protein
VAGNRGWEQNERDEMESAIMFLPSLGDMGDCVTASMI